ncbi:MAG: response regulator transcription factor [Solirubrobacterales bacterium]|nr:response regulator transcription factor [Solirubrobacterales bacterium]
MRSETLEDRRQGRPHPPRPPDTPVRVVIADHDGLARSMLRAVLAGSDGITLVAATGDGREAVELAGHYRPAVAILDTTLIAHSGMRLIRVMASRAPQTRVLTISAGDDETALAALKEGSFGHLTKDISPAKLAHLVKRAAAGEAIVPRRLTADLLELVGQFPNSRWRPLHSRLTNREWEIVELLADGASTQDIADSLVLSPTTVYSHVKSLLRKLGVHSRREAVQAAHTLRLQETVGEKPPQENSSEPTQANAPCGNPRSTREASAANRRIARVRSPDWQAATRT